MPEASGALSQAAFKKEKGLATASAYGDAPGATDLAAGNQIPFTGETLTRTNTRSRDPSLVGAQSTPASSLVAVPTGGSLSGRLRYRGFERIILMAMGFELPNGDDGSPKLIGTGEGTKTVTNATNATPIVVSVSSHGYSNGDGVQIVGVTGNTAANGDWAIAGVTGGTFELVDSSGNGTYGGSPTAEKYNVAAHIFEGDDTIEDTAWDGTDGRNPGFAAGDRKIRRGAYGVDKQVSDWVFYSSFVNKLTISGNPQGVDVSADLVCYDRIRGSYNSGSWTLPSGTPAQVLFQQCEIKLGTRAGGEGALSTIRPSSFEIAIDNKLKIDDQTTESGTHNEIPVRDNFREITFKLELPRYNTDTFSTLFDVDSEMACKVVFTGPTLAGGETYLYGFFMSSLAWSQNTINAAGPGRIPQTWEFFAEQPQGSDIFASGNYNSVSLQKDSELIVKVQNQDPQNYLTEV